MKISKLFIIRESNDMKFCGGPNRWTSELAEPGKEYDEQRWNSDESAARFGRLRRMYDFVWTDGGKGVGYLSPEKIIDGEVEPYTPDGGMTLFDWMMHADDFSLGQELRYAIQNGPWEDVLTSVEEIAKEGGVKLPPPKGGIPS